MTFGLIEIISYFMMIVILIQQVFLIVTLNLEMIRISDKIPVLWFRNINLLTLIPCITLWLLYSYFSPAVPFFLKITFSGVWLLSMFGIEALFNRFGFITFLRWNIGYSFVEWLIVIAGAFCFAMWYRNLIGKRAYP